MESDGTLYIYIVFYCLLHPQKDGLDFSTVLPSLLLRAGEKDIFGWDTCVGDALAITDHPDEDIRDTVLRLCWRQTLSFRRQA